MVLLPQKDWNLVKIILWLMAFCATWILLLTIAVGWPGLKSWYRAQVDPAYAEQRAQEQADWRRMQGVMRRLEEQRSAGGRFRERCAELRNKRVADLTVADMDDLDMCRTIR